ncbi:MAG: isocitrate/isopropylmalate dehydrogenase family protein [Methylococcales bacterium]
MHNVTLIKGDGIGPAIMDTAVKIIDATGVAINWEEAEAGMGAYEKHDTPLPDATVASIEKNRIAFKGPLTTPMGKGFRSINVELRKRFDLYANVRPARSWAGVVTPFKNIDIVVVRENTEGLYSGIEHYVGRDQRAAEAIKVITRDGCDRIIEYAFKYARDNNRKKVTLVHKANILKLTCGMFLDAGNEIAKNYPDIEYDQKIVDAVCMHMVTDPYQFDVIVTTNLFGDILSDLAAGLVGGLGLIPGANIGIDAALFEAVHGSAPDIAGKNIANPSAVILAGIMMLHHLGETAAAQRIQTALETVIEEGKTVTRDLNPQGVSTTEMGDAIIAAL